MTATWRRSVPWIAMAVVLTIALTVGSHRGGGPETESRRVQRLASQLRCPTCRNQSAAQSDAAAARAVRLEIHRRVQAGETDGEIRAFMVSRYGTDILLSPGRSGVAGLVWALPVLALVCAVAGLVVAFRRWRRRLRRGPTVEDRALVEGVRHGR